MTPLITLNDLVARHGVSSNTDFNKIIRRHVIDAQELDLRPLLGEHFYIDVLSNWAETADLWADLVNGSTYEYKGKNYQQPGLKYVVELLTMARYKGTAPIQDTPSGLVFKNNEYSERVDAKILAREEARSRANAEAYFVRVREYLDRNENLYENWKCTRTPLTGNGLRIIKSEKY